MKHEVSIMAGEAPCEPLADAELEAFLTGCLAGGPAADAIRSVERRVRKRRTDWRGSRLFEALTFDMAAGPPLRLFLKYRRRANLDSAVPATPMDREAGVYRELLQHAALGTARLYGAQTIQPDGPALLLLESLEGRKLKNVGEHEIWLQVVKWLARMHQHFSERQDQLQHCTFLARHDADFYWQWADRAAGSCTGLSAKVTSSMKRLLSCYDKVAGPLGGARATLVHGEFYCTNLIVTGDPQSLRVCAFDWETAAIGCGALDLTFLLRQRWGFAESTLSEAYLQGWRDAGGGFFSLPELEAHILRVKIHELMCRIWSGIRYKQATVERIEKYTERAMGYVECL